MGGTIDTPIKSYYDVLANGYKGKLPIWHTVNTRKNEIDNLADEQERFNKDVKAFIAQKKTIKEEKKAI